MTVMSEGRIPNKINIAGCEVAIIREVGLYERHDVWGMWRPDFNEIAIDHDAFDDMKWHTFYHELVHAILDTMGKKKLSRDEAFVDLFANLLYQALHK